MLNFLYALKAAQIKFETGVNTETAKMLKYVAMGKIRPEQMGLTKPESTHKRIYAKMECLRMLLGGECVREIECKTTFMQIGKTHSNVIGLYVDMGADYNATIVYDAEIEDFILETAGTFKERHKRRCEKCRQKAQNEQTQG